MISCCGSGGYGDVWLAEDRDGIRRAVKVLDKIRLMNLGVLGREEKAVRLFRTQVPEHPGLIRILHTGESCDFLYYVMELADNCASDGGPPYVPDTLEMRIRRDGAMAPECAIALMTALLDAVECLHGAGIVHRDIKPSNIIFIKAMPRLADMGLASSADTMTSVAGTQYFIPPENSTGSGADLYALGKLLYCCYTGNSPDKYPSLPKGLDMKDVSKLNLVALKACDPNQEGRFRNAAEFRAALRGGKMCSYGSRKKVFTRILRYALLPAAVAGASAWLIFHGDSAPPERAQLIRLADVELQRWHPDVALAYLDKVSLKWPKWAEKDEKYFKLRNSAGEMKKKLDKAGGEAVMKIILQASMALGSDPKRALELMEKVWKDPSSRKQARVISLYAMALAANDRFGEAVETMKIQTKLPDPEDADGGYAGLAELYEKKGMFKEALENLDLLISKHPDSRVYLNQKAMVCMSANDTDGALKVYRRMLEITPDNDDIKEIIESLEDTSQEAGKTGNR